MYDSDTFINTYDSILDTFDDEDYIFPLTFVESRKYFDVWKCGEFNYISNSKLIKFIKHLKFWCSLNESHTPLLHVLMSSDLVIKFSKSANRNFISSNRALNVIDYITKHHIHELTRTENYKFYDIIQDLKYYLNSSDFLGLSSQ